MPQNTRKDFLLTNSPASNGIICPACGSVMGLRYAASYHMILTENARHEFDRFARLLRRTLELLEYRLEGRNLLGVQHNQNQSYPYTRELKIYGLQADGTYPEETTKGVRTFIDELDLLEWRQIFGSNFPPHSDSHDDSDIDDETLINAVYEQLTAGSEPASVAGSLMDIIFDQRIVRHALKEAETTIEDLAKEVCPNICRYLNAARVALKETPDIELKPNFAERTRRFFQVIALLVGHEAEDCTRLSGGLLKYAIPFTLPRQTIISVDNLELLLRSDFVIRQSRLGWSDELKQILPLTPNTEAVSLRTDTMDKTNKIDELVKLLKDEIHLLINFCCTGDASYSPGSRESFAFANSDNELSFSQYSFLEERIAWSPKPEDLPTKDIRHKFEHEGQYCGWYPKTEPTHPVVLIGSPGTSKSTVMLTGLTTFITKLGSLGATARLESPSDRLLVKQYKRNYYHFSPPKPTRRGTRLSVMLSLEPTTRGFERTHFVFTDVPGEVASRSLTDEGSDPVVLGILRNAETVVFFFDLTLEDTIRNELRRGDTGDAWKHLDDSYERVANPRGGDRRHGAVVDVSQIDLLNQLIKEMRQLRSKPEDIDDIHFLCVLPKIDLFVMSEEKKGKANQYAFTSFYDKMKQSNVLVPAEEENQWRSAGGTGWEKFNAENPILSQKKLAEYISSEARDCLQNLGNGIAGDKADHLRKALNVQIKSDLIDNLERVFRKKVFFLPVSAQGSADETTHEGEMKAPNQKLSEFVFMTSVSLSLRDSGEETDTQTISVSSDDASLTEETVTNEAENAPSALMDMPHWASAELK